MWLFKSLNLKFLSILTIYSHILKQNNEGYIKKKQKTLIHINDGIYARNCIKKENST